MLSAVVQHLANQPAAGVLICLVVAIVLLIVAAVVAFMARAFWALLLAAGLIFFVLAFLIT
jgi:hypothetical protein